MLVRFYQINKYMLDLLYLMLGKVGPMDMYESILYKKLFRKYSLKKNKLYYLYQRIIKLYKIHPQFVLIKRRA